jgi:hypothetical protein
MSKRKIHAVTVTVYVEQTGHPALPKRSDIADGLVASLQGDPVDVQYGADSVGLSLTQTMEIIGVYSNLATDVSDQKGPDLRDLRGE